MAKKTKTKRFSLQGFDNKHYRTTQQYVNAVDALFDRATVEIAKVASKSTYDPDKAFSFDDYPQTKAKVQSITASLANNITSVVERGSRKQWLFACQKNDDFVTAIMDTSKLSKARLNKMQDRNLDALQTFQERKVNGMELSKRVWQYVGQYKDQIELGIDVGVGDGRSAQQLARDLKKNLVDPDRLFRRVRDKRGNLQLSKSAKAFHPGQGVYRSSVKNAQRLTRSEINMAYREADWLRWQQLDFVVGFEVKTSNKHDEWLRTVWNKSNKGKVEICDQLKGRYPKTFKFKGWHPQCMCYCVPILMDEETFDEQELSDLKSALKGTEYKKLEAKNVVKDVPQGFKDWVETNTEKQSNWGSTPYFIKDNFKDGKLSQGLNIKLSEESEQIIQIDYENQPREKKFDIRREFEQLANGFVDSLEDMLDAYKIDHSFIDSIVYAGADTDYNKLPLLRSEIKRLERELQVKIAQTEIAFNSALNRLKQLKNDAEAWAGIDANFVIKQMEDAFANDKSSLMSALGYMSRQEAMWIQKIDEAKAKYPNVISNAKSVSDLGASKKIDVSLLNSLIAQQPSSTRPATTIMDEIAKEVDNVNNAIQKADFQAKNPGVSANMPKEFASGGDYLHGEEYSFDADFFDLIDPSKPIKLEIVKKDDGAHFSPSKKLVHLCDSKRCAASNWERKAVVYHEFGHGIDDQRDLSASKELADMREAQIKALRKRDTYTFWEKSYNYQTGKYEWKKYEKKMMLVAYIDKKLQALMTKVWNMSAETFTKRGITKMDVVEQIGSVRDTIKSLVISYGDGHSTAYFKRFRNQEAEYLAHAFENAFIGNRVFQKYMPEIYNEMIAYIRSLK